MVVERAGDADCARTRSASNDEKRIASWTTPGAVDQLAARSCVRQARNGDSPRGGSCGIAGTGPVNGEPVMALN